MKRLRDAARRRAWIRPSRVALALVVALLATGLGAARCDLLLTAESKRLWRLENR